MPESVEEALGGAALHARRAAAEAIAAARCLLDALALVAEPAAPGSYAPLASLARMLDDLEAQVRGSEDGNRGGADALLAALADALEVEIARWQERAARDRDARAVLRAFLGLRELLWEVGVRPRDEKVRDAGTRHAQNAEPGAADVDERDLRGDERGEVRTRWRS